MYAYLLQFIRLNVNDWCWCFVGWKNYTYIRIYILAVDSYKIKIIFTDFQPKAWQYVILSTYKGWTYVCVLTLFVSPAFNVFKIWRPLRAIQSTNCNGMRHQHPHRNHVCSGSIFHFAVTFCQTQKIHEFRL